MFHDAVRQIRLSKQIAITGGNNSHVRVRFHVLNVGFDNGPEAFYGGYFVALTGNDAIDSLIHRLDGRIRSSSLRGILSERLLGLSKGHAGQNANRKY